MHLSKPVDKEDLRPAFQHIGAAGWDIWLHTMLVNYDIPNEIGLPTPATEEEIARCETKLGVSVPHNLRLFLENFGSLELEFFYMLAPEEIDFLSNIAIGFDLTSHQESQTKTMIAVARERMDIENLEDIYGLELTSGKIYRYSNAYGVLYEYLPSFDNLIKLQIIDLSWGSFGWDDEYIKDIAEELAMDELGLLEMQL